MAAPNALEFRNAFWREDEQSVAKLAPKTPVLENPAEAKESIKNMVLGIKAITDRMADPQFVEDCKALKPDAYAKTIMSLVKAVDETVRLVEFSQGNADSRQEVVGLSDLLKFLSDEEFAMVQTWIARGKPS